MTRATVSTTYSTRPTVSTTSTERLTSGFIMTQDLDFLMTQDGDYLVTQDTKQSNYTTRPTLTTIYN